MGKEGEGTMNNSEVYKVVGEAFKKSSLMIIGVSILISLVEIVSIYQSHVGVGKRYVINFEFYYIFIIIALFGMGIKYCLKNYGGWLSIRADRKRFLRGIVLVGIVGSPCIVGISYVLIWSIARLIVYLIQPIIVARVFTFKIGVLINMSSMGILCFALGACVGAIFYRLRPIVATALVSIPPIMIIIVIMSQLVFENKAWEILLSMMLMILQPFLDIGGQLIYTIIFWLIAYGLLIHAPMESYKYDLL